MIELAEPYASRPIELLGIWDYSGWRIKRYLAADPPSLEAYLADTLSGMV